MKGAISWLAAMTFAMGLGVAAYGVTSATQNSAYAAPANCLVASSCPNSHCGGKGKCPGGQCPKGGKQPDCCK
jgi:hypothetical protein